MRQSSEQQRQKKVLAACDPSCCNGNRREVSPERPSAVPSSCPLLHQECCHWRNWTPTTSKWQTATADKDKPTCSATLHRQTFNKKQVLGQRDPKVAIMRQAKRKISTSTVPTLPSWRGFEGFGVKPVSWKKSSFSGRQRCRAGWWQSCLEEILCFWRHFASYTRSHREVYISSCEIKYFIKQTKNRAKKTKCNSIHYSISVTSVLLARCL